MSYFNEVIMSDPKETISEVIDNLRRAIQAIDRYSRAAEQETGLTGPQLWAVTHIAKEAPIRVSELARRMYLHPATVVGILDRLAAKELISRNRSTADRRVVEIELTGKGRELVEKAPEVAQDMLVTGLEALDSGRLKQVAEGMAQLVRILGAEELPPQLLFSQEVNLPLSRSKR